ncbi:XdhC family protein [Micromonospora parathelypteridis]|uniref:Xanthine dehydrogenase accessory factor n=1 Tax=Micromonospora parathelypteridis TaxID=1839617 RepID=A0A840VGA6_9ACTN|nr:XdhC/CoxI family protein [Micromonospora parathelypteridis]MBB5475823.1 xanthine dehydrogenase accessory factor [Micromonospora parathelypteridis]GGO31662.1 xanthine dehydrogenase accessory factor [Micromonospora parathelypteridis]
MRDIVDGLTRWRTAGVAFAVATVVRTWQSAPRPAGAAMAVSAHGEVLGSISGGCVEGAVYELCRSALETGTAHTQTFGVSDDDAFDVGLTCGGTIQVLIQPGVALTEPDEVLAAISDGRPVATASVENAQLVIWPDRVAGSLGAPDLDDATARQAAGMLALGVSGTIHLGRQGEQRGDDVGVYVQSYVPPPRMIIFGAIDFAAAMARIGKFLGYHVTVCDARPVFATRARFPDADDLVVKWPHAYLESTTVDDRTVLCVLTHDPKFDVPLLQVALHTPARYIGVMGSRRAHDDRMRRLREAGVQESALARLHSPIGLDLGARTPEETAVAIAAEITAEAWGGSGRPLSDVRTPIHHT